MSKNLDELIKKMAKLYVQSETKGQVNKEERSLVGVVGSTGIIDRQGESLNPMGWLLENYQKNPVILYAHDYRSLPIGKATRVWVENNKLMFNIKFAETQFAKDVFDLFDQGVLNAFSVGFIPKELDSTGEYTWAKQELLELSAVPVPANPEALKGNEEATIKMKSIEDTLKKEGVELKAGRTLSAKNEDRLRQADALLNEILSTLDKEGDKSSEIVILRKEELSEIVKSAIGEALKSVKVIEEKIVEKIIEVDKKDVKAMEALKALRDNLKKTDYSVGKSLQLFKSIIDLSSTKGGDKK